MISDVETLSSPHLLRVVIFITHIVSQFLLNMPEVPEPILQALSLPSSKATLSTSGLGSGFTNTGTIRAEISDSNGPQERQHFVKTSSNGGIPFM